MGKRKLTFRPLRITLLPNRPLFKTQILFVTWRNDGTAPDSGHALQPTQARQNDTYAEDAYHKFRLKLQQALDGRPCTGKDDGTDMKAGQIQEPAINSSYGKATGAGHWPLVPQRPPDLEDIAFEILRQAQYKHSKRLG